MYCSCALEHFCKTRFSLRQKKKTENAENEKSYRDKPYFLRF